MFSPNLTAVHLCVLRDCYAEFEDGTICGIDLNLSDYFRVKKMNLKNVKFFKIRYYLQLPFFSNVGDIKIVKKYKAIK